jgi:hypothetical protein
MKKTFHIVASIILSCLFSVEAYAWGAVGHRTIGVIAERNLSPSAKREVEKILGEESLADVANWADALRSTSAYRQTSWYHFEKIPDQQTYLGNLKAMPVAQRKRGGVVSAVLRAVTILSDTKSTRAEQAVALKFLVHFLGDLHQPLHSGRPEDKGGVTISVNWFGLKTSLHGIWDSGMIRTGHTDLFSPPLAAGLSVDQDEDSPETHVDDDGIPLVKVDRIPAYVDYLEGRFKQTKTSTALDVEEWLNESIRLRQQAYDTSYLNDQPSYQNKNLDSVDLRIYQAGVRLSALLNDIFAGKAMPASEKKLIEEIEAIAGPLDSLISFKP